MSRLRYVYLYLVSFVTLMMILFGFIFTVQNAVDLIFPAENYSYPIPYRENGITEEEIKMYEENQQRELQNQINRNRKDVVKAVSVVFIAVPVFVYHWRKIETERKLEREEAAK